MPFCVMRGAQCGLVWGVRMRSGRMGALGLCSVTLCTCHPRDLGCACDAVCGNADATCGNGRSRPWHGGFKAK